MTEPLKVKHITTLSDLKMLVEFNTGVIKLYDAHELLEKYDLCAPLKNPEIFGKAFVPHGGYGVIWDENMDISEWGLWEGGIELPLTHQDMALFIRNNAITTDNACGLLNCTEQQFERLREKYEILPVIETDSEKFYSKSEILSVKFRLECIEYAKKFPSLEDEDGRSDEE